MDVIRPTSGDEAFTGQWRSLLVSAACAVGFGALGAWVAMDGSVYGDELVLRATELRNSQTRRILLGIRSATELRPLVSVAVGVSLVLLLGKRVSESAYFLVAVAGVWVLNPLLKQVFDRPRPSSAASYEGLSAYTFPSGHAANTAALVAALLMVLGPRGRFVGGLLGASVLACVALAQLLLGVHYPSDVMGGWLFAVAWVGAVWSVRSRALSLMQGAVVPEQSVDDNATTGSSCANYHDQDE